ncbi:hypothetical protein [Tardiphaga alba]|uniref:hypothetical protein n=1 Tax=Tardiphaga alba TaxID=340268 RepID=UPI001BA92F8D|nr:hypothetical protein [Tardiphaga alba]
MAAFALLKPPTVAANSAAAKILFMADLPWGVPQCDTTTKMMRLRERYAHAAKTLQDIDARRVELDGFWLNAA